VPGWILGPTRLKLPPTLRWVELDFPSLIKMKNAKLAEQQPICELERVGIDLLDRPNRKRLFARYGASSKHTLVITEGVLSFFPVHEVAALATELHSTASFRFWIQDFDNAGQRRLPRGWEEKLKAAPILFRVTDWFAFFEKYGRRSTQKVTSFEESQRLNRPYPLDFPFGLMLRALPASVSQQVLSVTGAVLMQRHHAQA